MQEPRYYIQVTEAFKTVGEANLVRGLLSAQDGYCGGRVLEPSSCEPGWRIQIFFQDEPKAALHPTHLPDGCERVLVPKFLRRRLGITK